MLLKYLFYGETVGAHLSYHDSCIISRSLRKANIKEGNIKSLTASKGDFMGKGFPLDYLVKN